MSIEEIYNLKDGTRVVITQIGTEWGEDQGESGICVKIGHRLVEADINRPDDENIWYPYYSINELNDTGYECLVELEDNTLQDRLTHEIMPDIMHCKDEMSLHNKCGEYGFDIDGQHLTIKFEWE